LPKIPNADATPDATGTAKDVTVDGGTGVDYPVYKLDRTRVAMIIETRFTHHMPALLSSYINIVPPAWVVQLVGTPEAFENVKESASLKPYIKAGKLILTDLPLDKYPVAGQEALSSTLTSLTFYRDFLAPAEWLLVFQTDSCLCAASEQSLDDWVDKAYDFVGAPWNPDVFGGNGGLSLRRVSSIVKALQNETRPPNYFLWEDRWLNDHLKALPPPAISKQFSVESVWYERPIGYHLRGSGKLLDGSVWLNATRRRHIFRYCPETKLILGNMNLEPADDVKREQKEKDEILKKLGLFVEPDVSDALTLQKPEDKAVEDTTPGDQTKEEVPPVDEKAAAETKAANDKAAAEKLAETAKDGKPEEKVVDIEPPKAGIPPPPPTAPDTPLPGLKEKMEGGS
jgi:hypothetical protein